jgi:hypothetical protein
MELFVLLAGAFIIAALAKIGGADSGRSTALGFLGSWLAYLVYLYYSVDVGSEVDGFEFWAILGAVAYSVIPTIVGASLGAFAGGRWLRSGLNRTPDELPARPRPGIHMGARPSFGSMLAYLAPRLAAAHAATKGFLTVVFLSLLIATLGVLGGEGFVGTFIRQGAVAGLSMFDAENGYLFVLVAVLSAASGFNPRVRNRSYAERALQFLAVCLAIPLAISLMGLFAKPQNVFMWVLMIASAGWLAVVVVLLWAAGRIIDAQPIGGADGAPDPIR